MDLLAEAEEMLSPSGGVEASRLAVSEGRQVLRVLDSEEDALPDGIWSCLADAESDLSDLEGLECESVSRVEEDQTPTSKKIKREDQTSEDVQINILQDGSAGNGGAADFGIDEDEEECAVCLELLDRSFHPQWFT